MESINRLRRYVECHDKITGLTATCINHFIDSIDKEVDDMWHALTIDAKPMTDENMAADGWVRLPVDADGVPIHARDMLDGYGKTIEVVEMRYGRSGWVLISGPGNAYADCAAFTHHHAPTVEDMLREFTRDWCNAACAGDMTNAERDAARADTIAEYAAKLRLAGDE